MKIEVMSKTKVFDSTEPYYVKFQLTPKNGIYKYTFTYTYGPTSNCQMITIAPFQYFLNTAFPEANIAFVKNIIEQCKAEIKIPSIATKMVLFDVRASLMDELIKKFGQPKIQTPYESTNGSQMVLGLLDFFHN
jgi:hypothetical protein